MARRSSPRTTPREVARDEPATRKKPVDDEAAAGRGGPGAAAVRPRARDPADARRARRARRRCRSPRAVLRRALRRGADHRPALRPELRGGDADRARAARPGGADAASIRRSLSAGSGSRRRRSSSCSSASISRCSDSRTTATGRRSWSRSQPRRQRSSRSRHTSRHAGGRLRLGAVPADRVALELRVDEQQAKDVRSHQDEHGTATTSPAWSRHTLGDVSRRQPFAGHRG